MPEPFGDNKNRATLRAFQKSEITEHAIYSKIAAATTDRTNHDVLTRIAADELIHYGIWKQYTGQDVKPDLLRVWLYFLAARVLGVTFTIKLMERMERHAQKLDQSMIGLIPEMPQMLANEESHERELIALIDEERLKYVGSMVLGLNDALVEFTGTLAGLTFAIQNTRIIAVARPDHGSCCHSLDGCLRIPFSTVGRWICRPCQGFPVYRNRLYRYRSVAHPAISGIT